RLKVAPGAALIVDYGKAATFAGDTLAAIRRGRKDADPLIDPGEADLTAHVDFAALAARLAATGARCWGPTSQGALLQALGIAARLDALQTAARKSEGGERRAAELAAGAERLIAPDAMGTLFMALAATSPGLPIPPGFDPASD
ncbi:MAG: SAM-dependent methyltransferase, partial [Rhodospirillaceae bacterium]|nr:SAM-dependent methyltransferase [Rhodospirillaceae bacterium]